MHAGHIVDAFLSIRDGVSLPANGERVPLVVRLRLPLAHHTHPARIVHPLRIPQQDVLIEAEPSLKNASQRFHPISKRIWIHTSLAHAPHYC